MKSERKQEDAKIGYERAIHLVDLVSREIHSLNSIMIAANSLFLTAIGLSLTRDVSSFYIIIILIFIPSGILLCRWWRRFISHGIYFQTKYRNEAIRLENEYYQRTFRLFTGEIKSLNCKKSSSFSIVNRNIINLFSIIYIIYLIMFLFLLINSYFLKIEFVSNQTLSNNTLF